MIMYVVALLGCACGGYLCILQAPLGVLVSSCHVDDWRRALDQVRMFTNGWEQSLMQKKGAFQGLASFSHVFVSYPSTKLTDSPLCFCDGFLSCLLPICILL